MWGKIVFILLIQTATAFAQDSGKHPADSAKHHSIKPKMTVTEVLAKYTDGWMEIPGVVGTAEGQKGGKPCIHIMVEKITPKIRKHFAKSVEGYPIELIETGKFEAR
jgi:hypothetical protein